MAKKFTRTKEDFVCGHCEIPVSGDGYTNHCPKCFWSKHVDKNPGDREELCGGMMEPVSLLYKKGDYAIVHRCVRCGFERSNRLASTDDLEGLIKLFSEKATQ